MTKVVQQLGKDHVIDLNVIIPSTSGLDLVCAQAYLGGVSIAEVLLCGAGVVICGRRSYVVEFKKELLRLKNYTNLVFPIGEIESNGESVITKEKTTSGIANVQTVTAQLLYEIQDPLYYSSDVTARREACK
ncbi:hypothetical protein PMIN03_005645 [Paraphaeosphaeria minitans]